MIKCDLTYKMQCENKPYKCVFNSCEAAGLKATRDNDWNIYWGYDKDLEIKKLNKN